MSNSRLIVTPSIVESFGLTSLEAIGLGIPLIAGRRSGFAVDLKRIVSDIPESAIDWLEVSDFDDLPRRLCEGMRRVLTNQVNCNRSAMMLAEKIAALWPTWKDSCRQWCMDVSRVRLEQPPNSALTPSPTNRPFDVLKGFKPETPVAATATTAPDEFKKSSVHLSYNAILQTLGHKSLKKPKQSTQKTFKASRS